MCASSFINFFSNRTTKLVLDKYRTTMPSLKRDDPNFKGEDITPTKDGSGCKCL
jgi:hypothetical protein